MPKCCVCETSQHVKVFTGIAEEKFPVCSLHRETIEYLDDCMGEDKGKVVEEAKRLCGL